MAFLCVILIANILIREGAACNAAGRVPRSLIAPGDHRRTSKGLEGPLLPILHGLQEEFGYVPRSRLPVIAEALNISRAEVHGVVTFYHDYRDIRPAGMC